MLKGRILSFNVDFNPIDVSSIGGLRSYIPGPAEAKGEIIFTEWTHEELGRLMNSEVEIVFEQPKSQQRPVKRYRMIITEDCKDGPQGS